MGPLPPDEGFDSIITMTDCLGADIRIVPSHSNLTAEQFAVIFRDVRMNYASSWYKIMLT